MEITHAQSLAIDHVRLKAKESQSQSIEKIIDIFNRNRITVSIKELLSIIRTHGRVTLNFHPDRILSNGYTIMDCF